MVKLPGKGLKRYRLRCNAKIKHLQGPKSARIVNFKGPIVDFASTQPSSSSMPQVIVRYLDDTVKVTLPNEPNKTINVGDHTICVDSQLNLFGLQDTHVGAWFFNEDFRIEYSRRGSGGTPCLGPKIDDSARPMAHSLAPQTYVARETVPRLREIPVLKSLEGPLTHLYRAMDYETIASVGNTVYIYKKFGSEYKRTRKYKSPIKTIALNSSAGGLEYALLETNGQLWIEQGRFQNYDEGPKLFYDGVAEIFFEGNLVALCKDGRILEWKMDEIFNQTYYSDMPRMICPRPTVTKPKGLVSFIQCYDQSIYALCVEP